MAEKSVQRGVLRQYRAARAGGPARHRPLLVGVALPALTVLAYFPVMQAGFIWDDDAYVTENPLLVEPGGLDRIWLDVDATPQYYPLVFTAFWLEHQLWDLQPLGYHLVNVMLHGATAVLLYLVLSRLSIPGAFLAAAVFALHPIEVESVAWITERKNVLSAFFYMLALLAYLRFEPSDGHGTPRNWWWWAACVVLFLCALLSKTVTCTLPAVLLLILWWRDQRWTWHKALPLLPLFALGAGMGLLTAWLERTHVGARGYLWDLSLADRFLIAGRAIWFYAGKLLWPFNLTFIYPRWQIDSGAVGPYVFPAAVALVLVLLYWQRRLLGRGPLVAVLAYIVTLFPALGFINTYPMQYAFVADHFQYLAAIPLIVLAAAGVASATARLGAWRYLPATVLLAGLGVMTWHQAGIYSDRETLWRDTLDKNPGCWLAHNNLGVLLYDRGDTDAALECYVTALRYNDRFAPAHFNLGSLLAERGRTAEAITQFRRGLELMPGNAQAFNRLGRIHEQRREYAAAVTNYRKAIAADPTYAPAWFNLARLQAEQGELESAADVVNQGLGLAPDDARAHRLRGDILRQLHQPRRAVDAYRRSLVLDRNQPGLANDLAWLLCTDADPAARQPAEALQLARQAATARPEDFAVLDTLAAALAANGAYADAARTADRAVELATRAGRSTIARDIAARRDTYQAGRPYLNDKEPITEGN